MLQPYDKLKLSPHLSEDTWKHTWYLQKKKKKLLKDPQTVRNKILWSDEPEF